jgi:hypothetical protein
MSRKIRTESKLKEASDHLHYEIWMLTSLAHGIGTGIAGQGPIANALLESFVVHVRALMDFLYNDNLKPDDVIAEDYFGNADEWKNIRPALSESLKQAKRRAGKEVAHLTYARLDVTPETKPWRFVDIANEIAAILNIFLENVPKSNLGKQWERTSVA